MRKTKPQPTEDKFWAEMEALLLKREEQPGPEWFSLNLLAQRTGVVNPSGRFYRNLAALVQTKQLENKKFKVNGKWTNYYRVKK